MRRVISMPYQGAKKEDERQESIRNTQVTAKEAASASTEILV